MISKRRACYLTYQQGVASGAKHLQRGKRPSSNTQNPQNMLLFVVELFESMGEKAENNQNGPDS